MQDDWKASFFAFFPNIWVTWFARLQTNKFEGLFKDKLQFSTTPFDSFNPLWSTYWLKHVMESFKIFTSSAMVDHLLIFILPSATRLCRMTGYDLQFHLRYGNTIWNRETEIKYRSCKKRFSCYQSVLQALTPRISQMFLGKIT